MMLTTWLLVFGSLTVAAIVIDGMRRMFASHAALSIDIDETLCGLPQEEYPSELPNGGARTVEAEAVTTPVFDNAGIELDQEPTLENDCGLDSEALDLDGLSMEDPSDEQMAIEDLNLEIDIDTNPLTLSGQTKEVVGMHISSTDEVIGSLVENLNEPLDIRSGELGLPHPNLLDHSNSVDCLDTDGILKVADILIPSELIEEAFELDAFPLSEGIKEVTSVIEVEKNTTATIVVSDSTLPVLDFDPTRPVHEWVETNSMVQSDLFAAQDLTALATVKSQVPHNLVETSDDILFSDTGIEEFTPDDELIPAPNQDESLSTKLAKVTSMTFGKKLLNRKRVAEKLATDLALETEQHKSTPDVEQVISILVIANKTQGFYGPHLLELLEGCGLVHGDMDIFHRFEDGLRLGKKQFSMANMMEPGTFLLNDMDQLHTPGVVFFLSLPTAQNSMQAFDFMLETALCLASNLSGDVLDDQRSVMRPQTIEHCRQQVRDFERRHMTRRAQL